MKLTEILKLTTQFSRDSQEMPRLSISFAVATTLDSTEFRSLEQLPVTLTVTDSLTLQNSKESPHLSMLIVMMMDSMTAQR